MGIGRAGGHVSLPHNEGSSKRGFSVEKWVVRMRILVKDKTEPALLRLCKEL